MSSERDPTRLQVADLCKYPGGCKKPRLGSSDLCPEHLNKRLEAEREARDRAREQGAGNWAGWDLPAAGGPAKGILGRVLEAAAGISSAAAAGTGASAGPSEKTETLDDIRKDIAAKVDRLAIPLLGGGKAGDLVERFAKTANWLTPEQEVEAWRVVRGLVDRGVTDVERWRAALPRPPAAEPKEPATGEAAALPLEADLGRAAIDGLSSAASLLGSTLAAQAKLFAKALEQAARVDGGPLDRRRLAAFTGFLEKSIGAFAKTARKGVFDAATRAVLGDRAAGVERVAGAARGAAEAAERALGLIRRRFEGRYETDPYGRDQDVVGLARPVLRFLYRRYFRVDASGLENVPAKGPALIAANHAGMLPFDAAMIATALEEEGPRRAARMLVFEWLAGLPFAASLLQKTGMVVAHPANGERLLLEGNLVGVFPEGPRGARAPLPGKGRAGASVLPFASRDFARMAARAKAPIVPCAIAIEPGFAPSFGPLGLVPLPAHWRIRFGPPIAAPADDREETLGRAAEETRGAIEGMLNSLTS